MSGGALKRRVEARDRLVEQARHLGDHLERAAVRGGHDVSDGAELRAQAQQLHTLAENLRIYQAELHAQADELEASRARAEALAGRFAAMFSGMPVACLLVSGQGEILEFNRLAGRLLALQAHGGVAFLHRLVDKDDYQRQVRPALHVAQAQGAASLPAVTFLGEGGGRFVGELHVSKLPVEETPAEGGVQFVCAVLDRSEHLQDLQALEDAAEALRRREALLADSARLARIGGWELQLAPRQLRCSEQLCSVFGLRSEQLATLEALLARCLPRDRERLAAAIAAAAEAGRPFEIELDMLGGLNQHLRVLAVGHAEPPQGPVQRVSGVLQDITQQHEARHELGSLTERLSMANEAGGIGVWEWDLTEGRVALDARMRQLLPGSERAPDLMGALLPHLQEGEEPALRQALATTLRRGDPLNLELQCQAPAGEERWLHLTGRAQFDGSGLALRMIGGAWDSSTEHRALHLMAAKEAAEGASRAKSAFLSRVSHELRTPLNAIVGFSHLMRIKIEAGERDPQPRWVGLIEDSARHLLALVNEVLDVSSIEAGRLEVRPEAVPLQPVVAEALAMVMVQASARSVALHDRTPPLQVLADRLRLKEVLINLLSNAVKYNRAGGQVQVDAETGPDGVTLVVADTGRGMTPDQLRELFQPFNRLGAETSGIEGSGMGLFVSQRIVELMGGHIGVQSAPGTGTTVRVRLPAAVAGPSSPA